MPPSSFSQSSYRFTHVGLDVHRDSISVAVLPPQLEVPECDRIFHDETSVRRVFTNLGDPRLLRACHEAGPTGYGVHRLLGSMGVRCDVVAPSLIPNRPGDRVKTDKRDARRLARLHRMGELTPSRVPPEAEEGVRDLCRAREDAIEDRRRARQRLGGMLLRHGLVYRDGAAWTMKHAAWLESQRFEDRAVQATYARYRATVSVRDADVEAIEAELLPWFDSELFHDRCSRLTAASSRPTGNMAFCGLVPSEYSSGNHTRRGHLTKAGNVQVRRQLIESAWAYQHPARLTNTSPPATRACTPTPSLEPGRPSSACADGSVSSPPARTPATSWSPLSPASWLGSSGPR